MTHYSNVKLIQLMLGFLGFFVANSSATTESRKDYIVFCDRNKNPFEKLDYMTEETSVHSRALLIGQNKTWLRASFTDAVAALVDATLIPNTPITWVDYIVPADGLETCDTVTNNIQIIDIGPAAFGLPILPFITDYDDIVTAEINNNTINIAEIIKLIVPIGNLKVYNIPVVYTGNEVTPSDVIKAIARTIEYKNSPRVSIFETDIIIHYNGPMFPSISDAFMDAERKMIPVFFSPEDSARAAIAASTYLQGATIQELYAEIARQDNCPDNLIAANIKLNAKHRFTEPYAATNAFNQFCIQFLAKAQRLQIILHSNSTESTINLGARYHTVSTKANITDPDTKPILFRSKTYNSVLKEHKFTPIQMEYKDDSLRIKFKKDGNKVLQFSKTVLNEQPLTAQFRIADQKNAKSATIKELRFCRD